MFLPRCSESLGCWGCVTEVTSSSEGGASHRHQSPSKEGNSTSLTIYRALKQFLCVSPSTWQISAIAEEHSQPLLSPPGMQGCFMSHSSSTHLSQLEVSLPSTWSKLSASPTTSKDDGNSSHLLPQKAPDPFLQLTHCRTHFGRISVER